MKEWRRKRGRRSLEERVENLRRASESIHSYPVHIFKRIHPRHILFVIAAILVSLTVIGGYKLLSNYNYYAAIIDTQLDQRLLQRHGGIYAAPRHVKVEQRITRDELSERLLRAGYQPWRDGISDDEFSSGSFSFEGDKIKLKTNYFARVDGMPETVTIKFGGPRDEQIVKIENAATGQELKSATLPPELLTEDGATAMHPRRQARFDEFPPSLINALIAIEDRNFFLHNGVDIKAVVRAIWENWRHGKIREGGSTITQQLIKTNFLTPERTYQRKFAEAMMAMALERRLSKEQIFTLYANRVYLGQSGFTAVYGFKQAARVLFGKELHDLSLTESALIAGLAQAPNRYSPYLRPDAAIARRNIVLDAMAETGEINESEAEAAKSEGLHVLPPVKADESAAQHFVDFVKRELASRNLGEKDEPNLEIRTTLDLDLQQAANIAVKNYLSKLDRIFNRRPKPSKTRGQSESAQPEAALIAIDPHTGEILAMVGGRNYASSQLNRVTDARRQPGSIFKPIVYATAIANGVSPETIFIDSPREILFGHEIYSPQNYGGSFSNQPVTLREGIVRSLNVVAVDAAILVGLRKVADMAEKMGLPRPEPYPSMALGAFEATPLEIAKAYSTFANGGVSVTPFGIKSIRKGELTDEKAITKSRVMRASTAYIVTDTLAEAVNRGTATHVRSLGYQGPAAGKTGTSRDSWFAGYTPNLLVVVWVGFDDNRNLNMTGNDAAAPIWTDFVKRALARRPDLQAERFTPPSGMEHLDIDPHSGTLSTENCAPRKRDMTNISKIRPECAAPTSNRANQNRPAGRKNNSDSVVPTRRRSGKRNRQTNPPTPARDVFRPMTDRNQFGVPFWVR